LPHPRLRERAFVLLPLAELAANWRHPATGEAISDLIAGLDPGQETRPLE
jgi:2-amino-4-hydroxy-6-hydroxymethyldihydropteridine diphosphokinase